jgi:arginase
LPNLSKPLSRGAGASAPSPIALIALPLGVGAPDQGCAKGPDALLAQGLEGRIRTLKRTVEVIRLGPNNTTPRSSDAISPTTTIRHHAERLAATIVECIRRGYQPLVLGGDHACAIGTWKGVAQAVAHRGAIGLVWLDAHLDAHTPATTPSGMLHGMPLAVLLGHGDARLVGLGQGACLDPRHLCLMGVRSFEAQESELLNGLGVRIIQMSEIDAKGLVATLREAVEIASGAPGGWGISIDLDVLDPLDAPGVGSPVAHGLEPQALIKALAGIAMTPGFLGAEMSEYNPELDPEGITGRVADALLVSMFSN